MQVKIEVLNPIECRVSKRTAKIIEPALTYTGVYYKKVPIEGTDKHRMERKEYPKRCWIDSDFDYWYFYRGHLDRIINHLEDRSISHTISWHDTCTLSSVKPSLRGIQFRKDQVELMSKVGDSEDQNGIIVAPTGVGKTVLELGIRSSFKNHKALILVHTIDIVQQIVDECEKFGFKDVQQIGGGKKYDGRFGHTVVSTIQSFSKIPIEEGWMTEFPVFIVDEAHHVTKFEGTYAKVLGDLHSTVRLGFTATLPTEEEAQLALEGLIGPVIGEQTINEASDLGILAKPKIKLLKSPFSREVKETRRYPDVYEKGIVQNYDRNMMIVNTILKHKKKGEVSLIFVNRIEHGEILAILFKRENGGYVPFVRGDMPPIERKNVKQSMLDRKRKIVIASTAWKEGINIPSLNVVFNAGGGKDELPVLQTIGRGLRRTSEKDEVVIYDIFDPSHFYLISHFGQRITLYMENDWL